MKRQSKILLSLLAAVLLLVVAGCGDSERLRVVRVFGLVGLER